MPDKNINMNFLAAITAVIFWSTSFIATKIAYETFTPVTLGALRTVIAVVILLMIKIIKKESEKPRGKDLLYIAASGLMGITLYFTAENIGVNLTSASNAALIVASFPAITSLFEYVIYRMKPDKIKAVGIIAAIIGVYILTSVGNKAGDKPAIFGNILLVLAGVIWALYNFITKKVVNKYPPVVFSYYQTLAGALFFMPLAILEFKKWVMPTFTSLAALLFLGIACSVTAFLLYNFGLRKLTASTAVSLMNLVPVLGLLFAVLFLHERASLQQVIGGLIVLFGVTLSTKTKVKKELD